MNTTRKSAIATGVLLILATVAALTADSLASTLTGPGYMVKVADHTDRLALAGLNYLIAAGSSASIAVALYPLLNKVNATLALGSVVFRTIEAVFYTIAVVSLLSLLPLARQIRANVPNDHAPLHATADALLSLRDHSNVAAIFAFSVGALLYYGLFYQTRLVPRWLSIWGLVGVLLMVTASLLALFSDNPVTGYKLLVLPIAIQEIVLALWLLARGFSPFPRTSGAVSNSVPTGTSASPPGVENHAAEPVGT